MRLFVLLFLLFFYGGTTFADQAYDRGSDKTYEGKFMMATSKGFRLRIDCYGPIKYFLWGSPRAGKGASFKRTSSCRLSPIGLTAGSAAGGGCDNWRDKRVLLIGFLNVKQGNWRYASALEAGGLTVRMRDLNGDLLVGDMKDVGEIKTIDGVCLDGGGTPRGSRAGLPASFKVIKRRK
ncbi:MAG: hypothetical protein GY927_02425 [bacterium]|nr:hypothetical protein [bacterium]